MSGSRSQTLDDAMSIFAREGARAVGKFAGLHAPGRGRGFPRWSGCGRAIPCGFVRRAAVGVGLLRREVRRRSVAFVNEPERNS